jgi:uncharacterized LabA/DUF88 family protein
MPKISVTAFIDGFNLYHAIDDLQQNHLKWVNLRTLMECFTDPGVHEIGKVYYFSAFATWLPGPHQRHRAYVAALEAHGITPVMATFKSKQRRCFKCKTSWTAHEEKESDVNIAVQMIESAVAGEFDQAFLVTGDSDLKAPLRFLRTHFPRKRLKVIAPPGRRHSKELWGLATDHAAVKTQHLARSLLPKTTTIAGEIVAIRPTSYDPPT